MAFLRRNDNPVTIHHLCARTIPAWLYAAAVFLIPVSVSGEGIAQKTTEPSQASSRADAEAAEVDYGRVGYAHISGVIDRMRYRYLQRVIDAAQKEQVDTLIVHIDTDGGEVFYARAMLKLLLDQARTDLRMIAFIDFRAISAGAMIAYGHEAIYISDTATIGDIGVIFSAPGGEMKYAPEKIQTIVRALLTQAAEQRNWNRALLLKMTARNQNLYRVTLPDGSTEYVIEDDWSDYLARHPGVDPDNRQQVIVYRGEDRLLTLTGREAVALGMATEVIPDLESLYRHLGIESATIVDLAPTGTETTAWYLSRVAPFLAGLALMFIIFELKTPGVGLWALLGGICAALFLIAQYSLDMVNHMEIVLVVLGMILVATEFLTMVGGGFLALVGGLIIFTGLVMAFLPNEFEFDLSDERYLNALGDAALSGVIAIGVMAAGIVGFIYTLPRTSIGRRLSVTSEVNATSAGRLEARMGDLVGRSGTACDAMHPGGIVLVDGEQYGARVEHGGFVDTGTPIKVIAVRFGELIVEPKDTPTEGEDSVR